MMPATLSHLSYPEILRARRMLKQGWGLTEIAVELRVGAGELDQGLWRWFARRP